MFWGLLDPDPDPLVRGTGTDPDPSVRGMDPPIRTKMSWIRNTAGKITPNLDTTRPKDHASTGHTTMMLDVVK